MMPMQTCSASPGDTSREKTKKNISMEQKLKIVKLFENGEKKADIGRMYGLAPSTIASIIERKEKIMKCPAPREATMTAKKGRGLTSEMEKLLVIWLEDQNQHNRPISFTSVQAKVQSLLRHLKAAGRASEGGCGKEFVASRDWFNDFKERENLHNIKVQDEAASADVSATRDFPEILKAIIEQGGYLPDQVFNVVETGLFWKRMPESTYISEEEKSAPGQKAAKDRLMLLLGGNASGDLKLKPLLVYRSQNPTALRHIIKENLPVIWKSNAKAWVTRAMFQDWFLSHFVPAVESYCMNKKMAFKVLLVLDDTPGHQGTLDDLHPNVKVVFLPPNSASRLQPMDQGVIASFKAYYLRWTFSQALFRVDGHSGPHIRATQDVEMCLREFWSNYSINDAIYNIADSWDEVKPSNMKGGWNKLCPKFADAFQDFTTDDIAKARQAVVDLGNQLLLDITENDVMQLLNSHDKELTNEELMELQQQMLAFEEEGGDLQTPEPKRFLRKELAEAFCLIDGGMAKLKEQDPNTERFIEASHSVNKSLSYYRAIYDEKKNNSE